MEWVSVYRAPNYVEAHLAKSFLEQAQVPVHVGSEPLPTGWEPVQVIDVLVPGTDAERARSVLASFERTDPSPRRPGPYLRRVQERNERLSVALHNQARFLLPIMAPLFLLGGAMELLALGSSGEDRTGTESWINGVVFIVLGIAGGYFRLTHYRHRRKATPRA